jgi:hypothetical protein
MFSPLSTRWDREKAPIYYKGFITFLRALLFSVLFVSSVVKITLAIVTINYSGHSNALVVEYKLE